MPHLPSSTPAAADADPPTGGGNISIRPAIFLEYGLDGTSGDDAACEICERGMRFRSRWKFDLGTMLNIAFSFEEGTPRRVEAESIVIECAPDGEKRHLTTLAFLDPPRELRANLGKVSARLVSSPA